MDDDSTRLARLEASFEFIKDLLKEIRDEVKNLPIREDYNKLEARIKVLEKNYTTLAVKVASGTILISISVPLLIKLVMG